MPSHERYLAVSNELSAFSQNEFHPLNATIFSSQLFSLKADC
jgi:hypothetical protein